MNFKDMYAGKDILELLESPLIAFYDFEADNGELLKIAASEIRSLRDWQSAAFIVDLNIDIAVEKYL